MSLAKSTSPAAALLAPLRTLFSKDVHIALVEIAGATAPLFPIEAAAMASATAARRREFAAGRLAARQALGHDCPIAMAADRAPVWPQGWTGSIAHNSDFAIAVATQAQSTLGVDIELASQLDEELISTICNNDELSTISGMKRGVAAKLIFSAKEAAYKAQYPQSRALFGFDHLQFEAASEGQAFAMTFVQDAHPFFAGERIEGQYAIVADQIICSATLPKRG